MTIPFRTGEIVSDEYFTNRAVEIRRIRRAMRGAERLLVYGERRQGKSSAIRQASLPVVKDGGVVAWADLWTAESTGEIAKRIVGGIPARWALRERFLLLLAERGLEPRVTIDAAGNPGISLGIHASRMGNRAGREILIHVLAGLNGMAAAHDKPVVVVVDEVQRISQITPDGDGLLRGIMQDTTNLAFILAGSILSLLDRQIAPKGALYNVERLDLGPMDPDHFAGWLEDRMKTNGVHPAPGCGQRILELAGPRTEDCVRLGKECFLQAQGSGRLALPDVETAFQRVVTDGASAFQTLWRELPRYQKAVLRAVALGVSQLHSTEARDLHALPTSGAITKAVRLLRDGGFISSADPPRYADPFFRAWVLLEAMPDGRPHS